VSESVELFSTARFKLNIAFEAETVKSFASSFSKSSQDTMNTNRIRRPKLSIRCFIINIELLRPI
ncbi:uncharacterized protein METZ01_LOCUS88600, partial [marine metagenome]